MPTANARAKTESPLYMSAATKKIIKRIVIDVDSSEIVCEGLSMPHSPRWYAGKLWLLNSGTGEFGMSISMPAGSSPWLSVPAICAG